MHRTLCLLCRKGGYVSPALRLLTHTLRAAVHDDAGGAEPRARPAGRSA